ncbi:MAG: hypothetical protein LBS06_01825 [Treponema sp.]|nr:hypothetical protein [Treponema sp.]
MSNDRIPKPEAEFDGFFARYCGVVTEKTSRAPSARGLGAAQGSPYLRGRTGQESGQGSG